jgi:integrase
MARRRYQTGTLRLRGKKEKVWTLRWREDVVGSDGVVQRIGRTTVLGTKADLATEKLARRRADVLLARINRPDYRPGKVMGFEEFSERWKEHALSQQKPSSQKVAKSHLHYHLLKYFGKLHLDQIGQEAVQQFIATIGQKLARHTILNVLGTLFSILRTARQWGYVVNEIRQSDLSIPSSKPSKPGRSFTAANVIAILEKAAEPWRTIFAVAAMTGMRPGEVLGLSTEDLDFDARQIFIRRSAWCSRLLTPKTRQSASSVPMPEPLERILRAYLLIWQPNPNRLLFANRRYNPYSENKVVQKRLWPILDELKIPRCGMHAFRHAMATLLLASGASPKTAQEQLRHTDPMTTMRMYVHTVGQDQRDAVEKVAGILRPNATKSEVKPRYVN